MRAHLRFSLWDVTLRRRMSPDVSNERVAFETSHRHIPEERKSRTHRAVFFFLLFCGGVRLLLCGLAAFKEPSEYGTFVK